MLQEKTRTDAYPNNYEEHKYKRHDMNFFSMLEKIKTMAI